MNRLFLSVMLLFPAAGFAQQTDSAIVNRLNQQWIASYAQKDTTAMQQILADDFLMISPKGTPLNRMDVIRNIGSPDITTTATIDSTSIRIFGQTALVVAYTRFSITSDGKTIHGSNCYSDLYVKRQGAWKAVAAHVTLISLKE